MKIIVGLGNPGPKYETTRHNVGFLVIDALVDRWKATGPTRAGKGEAFQANIGGERVYLLKPKTYMNLSGECVGPFFNFHKAQPQDLIVIHDDIDLKPFQIRVKSGGGTGGHNGLKSIDAALGDRQNGYHRIRIGVGRPSMSENPAESKMSPADYVLCQFSDAELIQLGDLLDPLAKATELLMSDRCSEAMNIFNRSN